MLELFSTFKVTCNMNSYILKKGNILKGIKKKIHYFPKICTALS